MSLNIRYLYLASFSEFFEKKLLKKRDKNKREIVGAVPRASLLALGRYLNQMFTIQGNYKNRAWILRTLEKESCWIKRLIPNCVSYWFTISFSLFFEPFKLIKVFAYIIVYQVYVKCSHKNYLFFYCHYKLLSYINQKSVLIFWTENKV